MSDAFWIALFATIPSLASLAGVIYSIRVSQGNRRVIDQVQSQTDGLLSHMTAAAEAKGVEAGHAAGVAAGVTAGAKEARENPTK